MYWEEQNTGGDRRVPDDVVDVIFSIKCRTLPVDHAYELSQCVTQVLPWFTSEAKTAMHTIHVAESANGWFRPDSEDQVLYPSKRTKLTLRVPKHRLEDTNKLIGQTLKFLDHSVTIEKSTTRLLSDITTLFARYLAVKEVEDEAKFMESIIALLAELNIKPKKMLCGTIKTMRIPEGEIQSRNLMLAELNFSESLKLQEMGLGLHQHMGCGIFLPHKDINQISEDLG